jgi:hypothetical protein
LGFNRRSIYCSLILNTHHQMKKPTLIKSTSLTAVLICVAMLSSLAAKAQTTVALWDFENAAITNYDPNPAPTVDNSAGAVTIGALGMGIYPTPNDGTNDPDILLGASGDTGTDGITNYTQVWRIRAQGVTPANGWSSQAPVGTQGIQVSVDTTGFGNLSVAFDWYATTKGEANLQLQYTTDGANWHNIAITIPSAQAGTDCAFVDNTSGSDPNSVQGFYVHLPANGQQWITNLTATITDPAAANNPNFGLRMVNASTGVACVGANGTALNNSSGNWRFDNIALNGAAISPSTIVTWIFDNLPQVVNTNPAPSLDNASGTVALNPVGMQLFGGGTTNASDITQGVSGDTGSNGIVDTTLVFRIRGKTGNGWTSTAPIGTQGAQIDVDTTGYSDIHVGFDWYLTTQGEANLQLQYTKDGVTWNNIAINIPAAEAGTGSDGIAGATLVQNTGSDANSVTGYYISSSISGQQWYTNLTAVISDPSAGNNPKFALRLVNASTGVDCVNSTGSALNNSSGNWRFDNIVIGGIPASALLTPPTITAAANATVDAPYTVTFTDSLAWRGAITGIKANGTTLSPSAYSISAGQIVFTPSASALLQTAGLVTFAIGATGYNFDFVDQQVAAGAPAKLLVSSEPVAPTGNGGTLVAQPKLVIVDQYNNITSSGTAGVVASVTASPNGAWSFGAGSGVTVALTNGIAAFTNLSATSSAAVSVANITFAVTGLPYSSLTSSNFNIPAPVTAGFIPGDLAVEQQDLVTANSTFSMLELSPTVSNSVPVNVFPVPATGSNGLRQTSSASAGRLTVSDDGTLLCFSAALTDDSTVSDVTTLNPRGAGTFDSRGNYVLQTSYLGDGQDSDQARSAVTVDNTNFYMGDKGGVFMNDETTNNAYIGYTAANGANVRSLKSFGGTVFALQQEGGTDPTATVIAIVPQPVGSAPPIPGAPANGSQSLFPLEGFLPDGNVLDFYMLRSGNNGSLYDVVYYIDGTNTTSGAIYKYYYTGAIDGNTSEQEWAPAGDAFNGSGQTPPTPVPWVTANGGDGLCAVTNVHGGVDLYYTTGGGASPGNSVVMVHDSAAWNQPINLTATNVLYTVSGQSSLRGIAFAPVSSNSIGFMPIKPIVITKNSPHIVGFGASAAFEFGFTNAPGGSGDFTVWGSTNISAPFSSWVNLGHPAEGLPGVYQFSDSAVSGVPTKFYQITSP